MTNKFCLSEKISTKNYVDNYVNQRNIKNIN